MKKQITTVLLKGFPFYSNKPQEKLVVRGIGTHYRGKAKGMDVISAQTGERFCYFVVPHGTFKLKQVVQRIPVTAKPVTNYWKGR